MATIEETVSETIDISPFGGGPTSDNVEYPQISWTLSDGVEIEDTDPEYYYQITREVEELVQWFTTTAQETTWNPVITQRIGVSVRMLKFYDSVTLTQAMTIAQTDAYYAYALRRIRERFRMGDVIANGLKLTATLTQYLSIRQTQKIYEHVTLTQDMELADAAALYQYANIIERLGIEDAVLMPWRVYATISDQLELASNLARYLNARVEDVIALVENIAQKRVIAPTLEQAVTITETLSRGLLLRVVANDAVEITHDDAIKMLFQPTLAEAMEIVSTYLDPEGITTWTVNLSHGGVTEYTNYNFNSFAKMGNKYIAASKDGLYELDGDDDEGDDIISRLKSGMLQFGKSNYSSFKGIYLGARGGGDWVLKLVTGDGKSYTYSVEARTMETTKVNVGKGLRARYFSYELISTGQDFDLDSIEFIPIVARRRV